MKSRLLLRIYISLHLQNRVFLPTPLLMAKIFPQKPIFSPFMTFKRETFTVWMKSLVCHTNGCTVFDSNGDIIYRVENYDTKCNDEVYLMDLRGRVLVTIRRKVLTKGLRLYFFLCLISSWDAIWGMINYKLKWVLLFLAEIITGFWTLVWV